MNVTALWNMTSFFSGISEEPTTEFTVTMGDTGQLCLCTVYMSFGTPRLHR